LVTARRWHLAYPPNRPGDTPPVTAAGANPLPDPRPNIQNIQPSVAFHGSERNAFADEQFLLTELAPLEEQPRTVTLVRLADLFGPILHAATLDEHDSDDAWLHTALSQDDDYLAVTRGQVYVGLLSRAAVLARIVGVLVGRSARA
jgi:hypothetical protein